MSDLTTQRDPWGDFGHPYLKTGVSRGTTTATGVITVVTDFPRTVVFTLPATDQATNLRNTATGGGPYQTQGTFFSFQPLTSDGRTARWRVTRFNHGGSNGTYTIASTLTGVTFRWAAFGY